MDEGTIKLHGSYRYLSERGIDFDRILSQYGTDEDQFEKEEQENDMDINVYDLSDEFLDDDSEANEDQKERENSSFKIDRIAQDYSPPKKADIPEAEESLGNNNSMKTTES